MSGVRRQVSLVALVWLLSHVTTMGVSLAGLCCTTASTGSASLSDEDVCCQGLAPGQICPLHKHDSHQPTRHAPSSPIPGGCTMRSVCHSAMTLPTLTLGVGLLPDVAAASDEPIVSVVNIETTPSLARSISPDRPPPRA